MLNGPLPIHYVSRNNLYRHRILDARKSVPLIGLETIHDWVVVTDYIQENAKRFKYPFLLMTGSDDQIVNN